MSEILSRVAYAAGVAVEEPLAGEDALPTVKAYVPEDADAPAKVNDARDALGRLATFGLAPIGELETRLVLQEEWLTAWRAHYRPLVVGRFLIKPSWIDVADAEHLIIELDPGMAFGTGLHPSTQQMLDALSSLELVGRSVLDVGTGSGILALAASAAGAARVLGVDTDAVAVRTARENVARCGAAIEIRQGSAGALGESFDVVLANIVARVIAEIAPELRARTRAGGALVVAGIVADAEDEAASALARVGFARIGRDVRADWVSLILRAS